MKNLITLILLFLFTLQSHTQDALTQTNYDIKACKAFELLGLDTINLRSTGKSLFNIDTNEIFKNVDLFCVNPFQKDLDTTLVLYSDTVSLATRKNVINQVIHNNTKRWSDYQTNCGLTFTKTKTKAFSNYSIPINITPTVSCIYHSWSFDSHYAGLEIIFIVYENHEAHIAKREIIWQS